MSSGQYQTWSVKQQVRRRLTSAREAAHRMFVALREHWNAIDKSRWQKAYLAATLFLCLVVTGGIGVGCYAYLKYSELVASRLADGVLQPSAQIYAEPDMIAPGYRGTLEDVVARLRRRWIF